MGQIADRLRANLKKVSASDAKQLRELNKLLKTKLPPS